MTGNRCFGGEPIKAERAEHEALKARVAELEAEVQRLRTKYETVPQPCGRGHQNILPLALWNCPTCSAQEQEIARLALASYEATRRMLVTPWNEWASELILADREARRQFMDAVKKLAAERKAAQAGANG